MTTSTIPHPRILLRDKWLAERKELLAHEKDLTKHYDRVNAERRRLSMVKIRKDYRFEGPSPQMLGKGRGPGDVVRQLDAAVGGVDALPAGPRGPRESFVQL